MAIARGQQSAEGGVFKLYNGVGTVKVLGVNMSKSELEKVYGRTLDKEPEYLSEVDVDGTKVKSAMVSFIVQTVPDKNNGIETITKHTFFVQNRYNKGKNSGKYQIIDAFGRTAWATEDDIKAKNIPMYANGPANIDADYRPALVGEEDLTLFIKRLLNIPNPMVYKNEGWVPNDKVAREDCFVRFDNLKKLFEGDFKEIKEVISYQPDNTVKIPFGIRRNDDGKMFQTTFTRLCFSNLTTDYDKLKVMVDDIKDRGGLSDTEFDACDLHEVELEPTNLDDGSNAGKESKKEVKKEENKGGSDNELPF